jgi:hypothetical protein
VELYISRICLTEHKPYISITPLRFEKHDNLIAGSEFHPLYNPAISELKDTLEKIFLLTQPTAWREEYQGPCGARSA